MYVQIVRVIIEIVVDTSASSVRKPLRANFVSSVSPAVEVSAHMQLFTIGGRGEAVPGREAGGL